MLYEIRKPQVVIGHGFEHNKHTIHKPRELLVDTERRVIPGTVPVESIVVSADLMLKLQRIK